MFKYTLFVAHLDQIFGFTAPKIEDWVDTDVNKFLSWLETIGVDLSLPNIHHLLKNGNCLEDGYLFQNEGALTVSGLTEHEWCETTCL